MKYAVLQCSNGSFSIVSEWQAYDKAVVNFHSTCTNLWNAKDVEHAAVQIIDEKFSVYKTEFIKYDE